MTPYPVVFSWIFSRENRDLGVAIFMKSYYASTCKPMDSIVLDMLYSGKLGTPEVKRMKVVFPHSLFPKARSKPLVSLQFQVSPSYYF